MKPVHNVSVQKAGGGHNLVSPQEFLSLPSNERINLIMQGKVSFLDEDGNLLPSMDAIKTLVSDAKK
jgi:hypothetical protein